MLRYYFSGGAPTERENPAKMMKTYPAGIRASWIDRLILSDEGKRRATMLLLLVPPSEMRKGTRPMSSLDLAR